MGKGPKKFDPSFRVRERRRCQPSRIKKQAENRSVTHNLHRVAKGPVILPAQIPQDELKGAGPGDRCPRAGCGGLLVVREVVTVDGSCQEVVCASCSRSRLVAYREPYRPVPVDRDARVALWLAPQKELETAKLESDDSVDIALPPAVLDSVWPATDSIV